MLRYVSATRDDEKKYHGVVFQLQHPSDRFGGPLFCQSWLYSLFSLSRVGRHQFIELCILRKELVKGTILPAQQSVRPAGTLDDIAQAGCPRCSTASPVPRGQWRSGSASLKIPSWPHQAGGVERSSSSTFCVSPVTSPLYLRDAFPQLVEEIGAVLIAEQNVKTHRRKSTF